MIPECYHVLSIRTSPYHSFLKQLPAAALVTDKYYKLPQHQPLYLKPTEVAYCLDRNSCSIRAVELRCLPLKPCELLLGRAVLSAYSLSRKYARLMNELLDLVSNELLPRGEAARRKFVQQLIDLVASAFKARDLESAYSLYKQTSQSYAGKRLLSAIRKLITVYSQRLPEPSKYEKLLGESCPDTMVGRYYRLYTGLKNLEKVMTTASLLKGT